MKKPVAKYWTTSSVSRMEPHIDTVVGFFVKQLESKFATGGEQEMGESFDFGEWCMFCKSCLVAQDVVGCVHVNSVPSW